MTLCAAWIRQSENEELVFATDSCLTCGEKWNSGIKLFELPRKDCLLCFAGSTMRAYPLILNLISSIKFDGRLLNPNNDIKEVLEYLQDLFTKLCATIQPVEREDIHQLRAEAEFLFGGWDWKEKNFCIWKLYYSKDAKGFVYNALHDKNSKRVNVFIGDELKEAKKLYKNEFISEESEEDADKFDKPLDMEPLKVLAKMSRDKKFHSIDGPLQVAKVYASGITEFFGVMWPNSNGKPTFLGQELSPFNKPPIRFIDPDTANIIEEPIPTSLNEISKEIYGSEMDFVQECYDENRQLKSDLNSKSRQRLLSIFKDVAYKQFLNNEEKRVENIL